MSSQNIVLIIQARMGSSRLPNKMMMDLAGAPIIGRVLERVKRVKSVDKIVLAIPDTNKDKVLVNITKEYNVDYYIGSENDLVGRYYNAAKEFKADVILRLPADNPVPEPSEYERIIKYHLNSNNDFSSNICNFMGNGYPDGIGVEVFNFESLEYIYQNVVDPFNREHVATNYYDYIKDEYPKHSKFKVGTINCPSQIRRPDLILDVNTQREYEFINQLYSYLYPMNPMFSIRDAINWYDNVYLKK